MAYRWGATPLHVVSIACLAALIFNLAAALLFEGPSSFPRTFSELSRLAALGFLGIFVYSGAFYRGIGVGGPVYPLLGNYLWPSFLVFLSVLRRRSVAHPAGWIGLALSFSGVCLAVLVQRGAENAAYSSPAGGIALGVLAALSWAIFSSYASEVQSKPFASQTIYNAAGMAGFVVIIVLQKGLPAISLRCILLLSCLGALVNGLAYVMWLMALRIGNPARIAPLAYLCPFLSLMLVALVLGEQVRMLTYAALVMNVAGVLIAERGVSMSEDALRNE